MLTVLNYGTLKQIETFGTSRFRADGPEVRWSDHNNILVIYFMGAKRKAPLKREIAQLPRVKKTHVDAVDSKDLTSLSGFDKDRDKESSSLSKFEVKDEIIFFDEVKIKGQRFEDGVWTVTSVETEVMIQIRYGCSETVKDDIDYSKIFAPKAMSMQDLGRLIEDGSAQYVKINVPKKEERLKEICIRSLADHKIDFQRLCALPAGLLTSIRARAEEITPIPIEYRIRRVADHCHRVSSDGPRMRQLTDAGTSPWSRRAWRLSPASLSYPSIWRACAKTLLPSRPAQIPPFTRLLLEAEPAQGAAAFHRDYVDACRRREPSFPLVFDHVWLIAATVIACGPAGGLAPGQGW